MSSDYYRYEIKIYFHEKWEKKVFTSRAECRKSQAFDALTFSLLLNHMIAICRLKNNRFVRRCERISFRKRVRVKRSKTKTHTLCIRTHTHSLSQAYVVYVLNL